MPSFFTSGFSSKRSAVRGKDASTKPSTAEKGTSSSPKSDDTTASWVMLQDPGGRLFWWNFKSGDWEYHTPIAPSSYYPFTPPWALYGHPLSTPGYPTYTATPGLYPTAQQQCLVSPSPSSVAMPWVPIPMIIGQKKTSSSEGGKVTKKNQEKKGDGKGGDYWVWEKFYDEDGRVAWIHRVTGKRTLVDPYH